jgi:hypothetical protein
MKKKINGLLFLLLISTTLFAQYGYQRSIKGVSDTWHSISLPTDIFDKVNKDFSDIRIMGIKDNGDTIYAPYFIEIETEKELSTKVNVEIINKSKTSKGYYYTLKAQNIEESIEEIELNFGLNNFDWKIKLEASQHLKKWFTIIENYRISAITNQRIRHSFSTLNIPKSQFRYYRIFIPTKEDPNLLSATIFTVKKKSGSKKTLPLLDLIQKEDKKKKETIVTAKIPHSLPIEGIKIDVQDDFDYYRPIKILTAKQNNEKSVKYNFLKNTMIRSDYQNSVRVAKTFTNQIKVIIRNEDNSPLNVQGISADYYEHKIVARFTEKAQYVLVYGNIMARKPHYDILQFKKNIPKNLTNLSLDSEIKTQNNKQKVKPKKALFENQYYLWSLMAFVVIVIGVFSFKMLKQQK